MNPPDTHTLMNRFTRTAAACTALALGASGLAGCDFTDGNDVDPNAATTATADLLLNGGEVGQILLQEGDFARLSGIFAGYFTGSDRQYAAFEQGRQNNDDFNATWSVGYQETLAQLDLALQRYNEAGNRVGAGVSKVHMALAYGTLADLFGDIPYTEALDSEQFENPAYTPQAEVYQGVINTLTEAIADLNSGQGSIGAATEVFYGETFGNASADIPGSYVQVAYTLLGRYNLNLQNYAAAAAAAENGISSPADNMVATHGGSLGSNVNQFYEFGLIDRGGYLTANDAFAVRLLSDDDDDLTDESERRAFYYSGPTPTADLNYGAFFGFAAPFPIVTFAENQLILAEARLQTDDRDGALDALNSVRVELDAQFKEVELDEEGLAVDSVGFYNQYDFEDFEEGGVANNGSDSPDNALLRAILEEKYIALIGRIQGFTDVRRTDNFIGIPGKSNGQVPQRFIYPRNEINANTSVPTPVPSSDVELPVFASFSYDGV